MSAKHIHDELNAVALSLAEYASIYLDRVAPEGHVRRTYAAVAAVGASFWILEGLLWVFLSPFLVRMLQAPATARTDAKAQLRKAQGAAVQAVARLVGGLHNTIQVFLGLVMLLDSRYTANRVFLATPLSYAVAYISAGYFLHDLVMCMIRFSLEGPLYMLHALCAHVAYTFFAATGYLHYHAAAFIMWEISTPFVHLRWFMYKSGLANTKLYVLNGICMVLAFFACRIVWGYYIAYLLVRDVVGERLAPGGSPFPVGGTVGYCIAAAFLTCLNTHWFFKMVSAAAAVLVKGKKGSDVGSHKDE